MYDNTKKLKTVNFFAPLGVLFIMKRLKDEWYVVIKAKKRHKSTNQKVTRLSSSPSDGLVHNSVTFSQWFSHKTAAFYTEQYTSPLLFTTLKSHVCTGLSLASPFSKIVRMCTNHLATKQLLFKFYTVVCKKTGRVFCIHC